MTYQWAGQPIPAGGSKGAIVYNNGLLTTRTVRTSTEMKVILVLGSLDGKQWSDGPTMVRKVNTPGLDIGDGCLLGLDHRTLWYSFRDNNNVKKEFSIRVVVSTDAGKTWGDHSVVATSKGHRRGLWASYLFASQSRDVVCAYDDEDTPFDTFPGHQWLTAKRCERDKKRWGPPVTVSRAFDRKALSRDGMPSLVSLGGSRIGCALETVATGAIPSSQIMFVTSNDHGKSWSWIREERTLIFASCKPGYAAYAPWLTTMPDGDLVCVFTSNDRADKSDAPGTPAGQLHGDILMSVSDNQGVSWGSPTVVYAGGNRNYMPQIVITDSKTAICLSLDHALNQFTAVSGTRKS